MSQYVLHQVHWAKQIWELIWILALNSIPVSDQHIPSKVSTPNKHEMGQSTPACSFPPLPSVQSERFLSTVQRCKLSEVLLIKLLIKGHMEPLYSLVCSVKITLYVLDPGEFIFTIPNMCSEMIFLHKISLPRPATTFRREFWLKKKHALVA